MEEPNFNTGFSLFDLLTLSFLLVAGIALVAMYYSLQNENNCKNK